MAVQKNFVIQNGLEVNNNLIFADKGSNKVGIATTNPKYTLHVIGGIGATNSVVTGISTVTDLIIGGKVSAGSTFGAAGQYLVSTGAGVTWSAVPTVRSSDLQTAGVGATTFNTTYAVGLLDVYDNGVKLSSDEFTANNGATVVLDDACFGGETVEFISYSPFGIGIGGTSIQGITVLEEGSPVGSPLQITSINFVGASVTAVGSGYGVTVYLSDYVASAGIATYANTAGIATYASTAGVATIAQGLTGTPNIEVGIITATNVIVGGATTQLIVTGDARVTGILAIGTSSIILDGSTNTIEIGGGIVLQGNEGTISATSITINGETLSGAGVTYITAGSGISVDQNSGNVTITATGGGGSSQWETTAAGIHTLSNVGIGTTNPTSALTVKGNTSLETLNVSGVSTFNSDVNIQGLVGINTTIYDSTFVIATFGEAQPELMCLDGPSNGNRYGLFSQYANETTITSRDGNNYGTIKLNQYDGSTVQTSILIPPSGNIGIGTTNASSKLTVRGGDISVGVSTAHGVILTSPNGTQYRLIVDDSGTLSTVTV